MDIVLKIRFKSAAPHPKTVHKQRLFMLNPYNLFLLSLLSYWIYWYALNFYQHY